MERHIKERASPAISEKVFPGCVIGIFKNNRREIFPFGNLTYDPLSAGVTEETMYDVASVTKVIPTASLLLKLLDDGSADLADPIARYIPKFGNAPEKRTVTLRHLLTYTLDLDVPAMQSLRDKTPEEIIDRVVTSPLRSTPGTRFKYTNSTAR